MEREIKCQEVYVPINIGWETPYGMGLDKLERLFNKLQLNGLSCGGATWYNGIICVPVKKTEFEDKKNKIEEFVRNYIKSDK